MIATDVVFLPEVPDIFLCLIFFVPDVNTNEVQFFPVVFCRNLCKDGSLPSAVRSPRGPEVEDGRFALQVRQANCSTFKELKVKVRCLLPDRNGLSSVGEEQRQEYDDADRTIKSFFHFSSNLFC